MLNTAPSLDNRTFCRGLCELEGQAIKGSSVTLQKEQRAIKGQWFLQKLFKPSQAAITSALMTPDLPEQAADLCLDSQAQFNHVCEPEHATCHSLLGRRESQSRHGHSRRATSAPPQLPRHLWHCRCFVHQCSSSTVFLWKIRFAASDSLASSAAEPWHQTGPAVLPKMCVQHGEPQRSHRKPGAPLQRAPTPLHRLC